MSDSAGGARAVRLPPRLVLHRGRRHDGVFELAPDATPTQRRPISSHSSKNKATETTQIAVFCDSASIARRPLNVDHEGSADNGTSARRTRARTATHTLCAYDARPAKKPPSSYAPIAEPAPQSPQICAPPPRALGKPFPIPCPIWVYMPAWGTDGVPWCLLSSTPQHRNNRPAFACVL